MKCDKNKNNDDDDLLSCESGAYKHRDKKNFFQ